MHEIRNYIILMDVIKTLLCLDEWNKFTLLSTQL